MIDSLFTAVTSLVVLLIAAVVHPHAASCPTGWVHDGIRPTGSFTCRPHVIGGENDPPGHSRAFQPPGEISGQIYCTGGSVPIVVDYRTVGCNRIFK